MSGMKREVERLADVVLTQLEREGVVAGTCGPVAADFCARFGVMGSDVPEMFKAAVVERVAGDLLRQEPVAPTFVWKRTSVWS